MMNKDFAEALSNAIDRIQNKSYTENGALGYKTTRNAILDMNFKVASYRNRSDKEILQDFYEAMNCDLKLAVTWAFYARDVRQGLGERRLFKVIVKDLAQNHTDIVEKLIPVIAEYGRYDDLLCLLDTPVKKVVAKHLLDQLAIDMRKQLEKKPISLLAKWMPSINTSSKKSRELAEMLANTWGISPRTYRKMLSGLRSYLKIVERDMSANSWDKIDYEAVPSKANLIYKNAFLKHDEERRREYLGRVSSGEARINSKAAFPHEIIKSYTSQDRVNAYDATLEAMWKALPNFDIENTIVVADGSGSMTWMTNPAMPLDIANGLAIYCAERCKGAFKNTYITFSDNPKLVHLNVESLHDKIQIALQHSECSSTNIEKVFKLILSTAIENNMKQEDLPKNVLIISDMEFNQGAYGYQTLFTSIANMYNAHGYKLPKLIFWNVASRTNTIPMTQNENGVILVSGFSVNILNMVMNDKMDPWEALKETLLSKRYDAIRYAFES